MSELHAGIAYAEDARFSTDPDRRDRGLRYARQAHTAVTQIRDRMELAPSDAERLAEGLAKLADAIRAAEENSAGFD
jgi:hypothetical protein